LTSQGRWTLSISSGVITIGALPAFLVGVYAVDLKRELGIDDGLIGLLLTAYFGTSAVLSAPTGRLVERIGARAGMAASLLGVSVFSAVLVGFGRNYAAVAILLVLCVASHAASHPASNLALAEYVPPHRRGLAFGIKQAAIPAATFLAGLSMPVLGAHFGWRVAFALLPMTGAILLLLLWARMPKGGQAVRKGGGVRPAGSAALRWMALAVALAIAGIQPVGAFFVAWGTSEGMEKAALATLLSTAGLAGIVVRVALGWAADRRAADSLVPTVSSLIAAGAAGVALLAVASSYPVAALGVGIAVVVGWSWNGLFHYAVVRNHPRSPAYASSIAQGGLFVGVALGPLGFGLVAEYQSYLTAWLMASGLMLCGAVIMAYAWRQLRRQRVSDEVEVTANGAGR